MRRSLAQCCQAKSLTYSFQAHGNDQVVSCLHLIHNTVYFEAGGCGLLPPRVPRVLLPACVVPRMYRSLVFLAIALGSSVAGANEPAGKSLERRFADEVQPFLKTYCFTCHGEKKQEAKLDFRGFSSLPAVVKN